MSLKVEEIRRRTCIAPVSTGSVAPKRGSVARKARTRKIASIMSPRACLIASAASSRSYSEPSVMTRSTPSDKLLGDLRQRELGNVAVAAPLMRQQPMGVLDGAFASFDGNIHD